MEKAAQHLESLFAQRGGLLTRRELDDAGLDPHLLVQGVRSGRIERLQRGVYRLTQTPPLGFDDLLEVQLRLPRSVTCLVSALSFHGLTVLNPGYVEVAVPAGVRFPQLEYPPVQVYTFSGDHFSYGIETHILGDRPLRVYSMEKTLVDLLRLSHRLGREPFLEGLKTYLRPHPSRRRNLPRLLEAARIGRMEARLKGILEVLLA